MEILSTENMTDRVEEGEGGGGGGKAIEQINNYKKEPRYPATNKILGI